VSIRKLKERQKLMTESDMTVTVASKKLENTIV